MLKPSLLLLLLAVSVRGQEFSSPHPDPSFTADGKWQLHDPNRPWPQRALPKSEQELAHLAKPPKDAVVLFDGTNLDAWEVPQTWSIKEGSLVVQRSPQDLSSKQAFGSCRLHLEWMAPEDSPNQGQDRANSGIFLMSNYEVQVLDTYENRTYADGMAAALYGVKPPDVNALRPSGQWQHYDIWFKRPSFDGSGKLLSPAYVTVLVNGVVVQQNVPFDGPSSHKRRAPYRAHADALPLRLQYHGQTVSFRNIWIQPIADDAVTSPAGPLGSPK